MANILVAEDSLTHTEVIRSILESAGDHVECAKDGQEAWQRVQEKDFDLIVSDLNMPVMDGCELVRQLTDSHPHIPVVVVTARGSESLAVDALAIGATDFVPKDFMAPLLPKVTHQLARYRNADQMAEGLDGRLKSPEFYFKIGNETASISAVAEYLVMTMAAAKCGNANLRYRVATAVASAVFNAIEYGNLQRDALQTAETPAVESPVASNGSQSELAQPFPVQPMTAELSVRVKVSVADEDTRVSVAHDGDGALTRTSPAPGTPESFENEHSRGLVLMTSFMDDVMFNHRRSEVTMIKRHSP